MKRPALEVADIFRDHGAAWRNANAGHLSLGQLQVMSAIGTGDYAGGSWPLAISGDSRSSGLITLRMVVVATCA